METIDICGTKEVVTEVKGYFTSEDIIKLNEAIAATGSFSIKGLIQYFDAKLQCNRVVSLLNNIIEEGIKVTPSIVFHPVTERCDVKNGVFYITSKPYFMGSSIFINNLIVVKNSDNTYSFYDDVDFTLDSLKCSLNDETVNGTATVSYFVLDEETVGGLDYTLENI